MSAISTILVVAIAFLHVSSGSFPDRLDELAEYPAFQRGLRNYWHKMHSGRHHHNGHHHGHLRASSKRSLALVHHVPADLGVGVAAPRLDWNPDDVAPEAQSALSNADDVRRQTADAINGRIMTLPLPGRHPSVEKALGGMTMELHALKEKQIAENNARNQLSSSVGDAASHMSEAIAIKKAMAQKQAQLRLDKSKLKMLEYEGQQVESSHTSLINSLHRVLEPKLIFARERLLKRERSFEDGERTALNWRNKKDQLKQSAMELIKGRNAAKENLLQVEEEVAEAKRKEESARRGLERQRQRTSEEVQSYQYAETRFKAEVAHEEAAKQAALAAKESVAKLDNVMSLETHKVDESMLLQKHRLEEKRRTIEAARERSGQDLQRLEAQYREWQENQRRRAADVVKKSHDTMDASEAYEVGQKQVLESAEKKVVKDAVSKNDWAWENDFNDQAVSPEASFSD